MRNGATMRPTEFSAHTIIALLGKQTIATLPEVMAALGPRASRRTAFRKLKDLDARTSYSHRDGYYTLDALADFDQRGLWSFAGVRFSRAGTLLATGESFVNHAEAGHFVDELDNLLAVGTQDALRKLAGDVEHRLFCEVSKNWAGRPLDSYETILKYLRTTRTTTGLRVRAHLVRRTYKTGVKVTDAQMEQLRITSDSRLPKWNYTIEPM